jgi:YVTN family beta-propeller protein
MTRTRISRKLALCLLALAALTYGGLRLNARPTGEPSPTAIVGKLADGIYLVPTGQTLTPSGLNLTFDGRPVDMALSPDGKTLAVMLGKEVRFFDTTTRQFRAETLPGPHDFGGIVWSPDGKTLYSTGNVKSRSAGDDDPATGVVYVTQFDADGHATPDKPISFPLNSRIQPNKKAKDSRPSGLALSPDGKTLYVALFNNGTVAAVDLSTYNPTTGAATFNEALVGSSPERLLLSADGSKLYVANRGGKTPDAGDTVDNDDPVVVDPDTYKASTGTLTVVNTEWITKDPSQVDPSEISKDPAHSGPESKTIPVGLQPADLTFSPDGKHLFVANANADSISVISTDSDSVVETILTSPAPGGLAESSPNGLKVSKDGATLYVTLGGDNAVEVVTLDQMAGGTASATHIAGLIPTAWFPLGILLSADSSSLYVINNKGVGSLGNAVTRPWTDAATPEAGPGGVLVTKNLTGHSVYSVMGSLSVIPVPDAQTLKRDTAQVAHNDHFDRMAQALNQKPDPFWSRFKHVVLVIKENRTYDQILGDIPVPPGHIGGDPNLVMFGEKITPNQHALAHEFGLFDNLYCTGEISADGHHWLNEAFADDYDERARDNYPRSYPCCGTDPLVYAGNKFLWQAAMDAGRTFYNYGEFFPLPSMQRHSSMEYNAKYIVTPDRNEDVAHCERILADLDDSSKGLSQLTTIWFPNNHTSGTKPGAYTPESCIADNDLALGKLVEAISHSQKYWHDEPTAIFVVEDDAQGGLDHVEGHRTTGLVISPFNKRGQVFSTNFSQLTMLHTIEQMLDLKPLNQLDAAAISMRSVFTDKGDFKPFTVHQNEVALNLINPPLKRLSDVPRRWAAVSAQLDFSAPDRADPDKLTEVLWHHTHGSAAYPPPTAAR